jgi:hypothetical protein
VNRPDDRAALLGRLVAALSKPEGDLRVALERASVTEAGIAPTMARRVWDLTLARYSPEALAGLCSQADAGLRVGVVLGVSVAVAPLRALVLPLLSGASVGLRPSRRQPTVAMLLREAMAAEGLPVWAWSGVGGEPVDRVVAYGRDETLDAMAAALPSGVEFVGYGHGYGVAVVAADDAHDAAAEAVALDVALHDQRGCLSPDADEEAVAEVALELAVEDLLRRRLDVVLDPLEVELLRVGVVDRVARAVVVVARLADAADAHDVLPAGSRVKSRRAALDRLGRRELEHLAQVRVADEREVPSSSKIGRHSRACSGAKMYSNSSRRTGEPWQRCTPCPPGGPACRAARGATPCSRGRARRRAGRAPGARPRSSSE